MEDTQSEQYQQYCLLLVGPTASGKSYLEKRLVTDYPDYFHKTISLTTRPPRVGEKDGVDYHFVTQEQFDETIKVESITFAGNSYGLSIDEFQGTKKHLICVVEPTGCEQIINSMSNELKEYFPNIKLAVVFFDINQDVRVSKMKQRGDSEESILKRIEVDDIQDRFKILQPTIMDKLSFYSRVIDISDDIFYTILDTFLNKSIHTYVLHFCAVDDVCCSGSSISLWDENTLDEIKRSRVVFAGKNKVVCHIYGDVSNKYFPDYNQFANEYKKIVFDQHYPF